MKNPSNPLSMALWAASIAAITGPSMAQQVPARADTGVTSATPMATARTESTTGTVTAVNLAQRVVQVDTEPGRPMSLFVGPSVKNLRNVKVGDRVSVRYTEAFSYALAEVPGNTEKVGEIRTKVETRAAAHPTGDRPGMGVTEQTTIVANVFEIDRDQNTVTLRGTSGVPVKVRVSDPQALRQIDLNDQVIMSYTEAAVVSIQPSESGTSSPTR